MNVIATRYDYYIEIETEMKHAAICFCRGLLTLPEHLSSPPIFSEVRVTRSLV